jgi:hypothetical protein
MGRLIAAGLCLSAIAAGLAPFGVGFDVAPLPAMRNIAGDLMSCIKASRAGGAMRVCEVIRDDKGKSWPDASSWHWNAEGTPWWSFVVARAAE